MRRAENNASSCTSGIFAVIAAALSLAISGLAYGQVYKWIDKDGKTHYSDQPLAADAKQQAPVTKPPSTRSLSDEAKSTPESRRSEARQEASSGAKFRPEEKAGLCILFTINSAQLGCMLTTGKFCSLDDLAKGIGPEKAQVFAKDPRVDPNYEHRITIGKETYAWSATPRRPGLAGFFYDGRKTYYNPNGPASNQDKVVGDVDC